MPGGGGGAASRGVPLSRSIRTSACDQLPPSPPQRHVGGGKGGGSVAGSIGEAQALAAVSGGLFDELVAGRADRQRAGRAAIAVEGRIAAEFQRIGDELGACCPAR